MTNITMNENNSSIRITSSITLMEPHLPPPNQVGLFFFLLLKNLLNLTTSFSRLLKGKRREGRKFKGRISFWTLS